MKRITKILFSLTLVLCVAISSIAFVGCKNKGNKKADETEQAQNQPNPDEESATETYSFVNTEKQYGVKFLNNTTAVVHDYCCTYFCSYTQDETAYYFAQIDSANPKDNAVFTLQKADLVLSGDDLVSPSLESGYSAALVETKDAALVVGNFVGAVDYAYSYSTEQHEYEKPSKFSSSYIIQNDGSAYYVGYDGEALKCLATMVGDVLVVVFEDNDLWEDGNPFYVEKAADHNQELKTFEFGKYADKDLIYTTLGDDAQEKDYFCSVDTAIDFGGNDKLTFTASRILSQSMDGEQIYTADLTLEIFANNTVHLVFINSKLDIDAYGNWIGDINITGTWIGVANRFVITLDQGCKFFFFGNLFGIAEFEGEYSSVRNISGTEYCIGWDKQ